MAGINNLRGFIQYSVLCTLPFSTFTFTVQFGECIEITDWHILVLTKCVYRGEGSDYRYCKGWVVLKEFKYIRRVQPTSCNVSQFIYFCKTLYMFQTGFLSIIKSSKLHIQRQVPYLSDQYLALYVQFWAPDDGRKTRLKHVERLTEINKLWNFATCWLYSANILAIHGPMDVRIKFT